MDESGRSRWDDLLDLLADEVAARLAARSSPAEPAPELLAPVTAGAALEPKRESVPETAQSYDPLPAPAAHLAPTSHAARLMAQLALGVLVVLVLINIPYNTQGTALARSIPSSASLVIANGLLVKENASPDVYLYRDSAFHWITTLDAFQQLGYRWQEVHIVEPGFLAQFDKGRPIYLLAKCAASPNIYRIEDGRKRWIVDIPTFTAEGYVWQDVKFVPCPYLHALPDGDSIPPGRGSPPPPLP